MRDNTSHTRRPPLSPRAANAATTKQLAYIVELCGRLRIAPHQAGPAKTFDEAGAVIDDLLKRLPIQATTRQAIFALMREVGKNKADLYQTIGIDSLSDTGGATEADGQRALRWLRGETVEVRRVHPDAELRAAAEAIKNPAPPSKPRRLGVMQGAVAKEEAPTQLGVDDKEADIALSEILMCSEGKKRDWTTDHINPLPCLWGHWQARARDPAKYQVFRRALERRGLASAVPEVVWTTKQEVAA